MAKNEDQRILVWCNCSELLQYSVFDAVYMALKFDREICLFANYQNEKEKEILRKRIISYAQIINKDIPTVRTSTLLLRGKLHEIITKLGEKYNTVLLCISGEINKTVLKAFYKSKFPFFITKQQSSETTKFKKIIIPIDFRRSTKDATLWGSYFGRLNESEITLLKANDKKDKDQMQKVNSNIDSTINLYKEFSFLFNIINGKNSSWSIHKEASSLTSNHNLLIFTGSLNYTLFDWFFSPFEKRIVDKSTCSVLLINPQKEMYLLCN